MNLPRITASIKNGNEPLHNHDFNLPFTVSDFWRWSASDLLSNTTRGRLAEFIVATALNISIDEPRDEWAAWDLTTPEGIKVEVKSAAFIQSWFQTRYSKIQFKVKKTRTWNPDINQQEQSSRRQAQAYVFAILAQEDQNTIDPLDVSQWEFYVLPTTVLDNRKRSQDSITIPSLRKLCNPVSYELLRKEVLISIV